MTGQISRRAFLGHATTCACATPFVARAGTLGGEAPMLRSVERRAVMLDAGPLRDQLDHQHRLFMGLDDDRLLKPFRVLAGQDAPGADMGGWYDASSDFHVDPADWGSANWHGYIPGHSFGQYLSGLARIYAATGDSATRAKVQSMVDGYVATISPRFFDDYNLPAYTYDKIVIGLVDAWRYAGVATARDALDRVTDAVLPFLPTHALTREERRALPYTREAQIWDEPYTLPEHLFLATEAGMGERYGPAMGSRRLDRWAAGHRVAGLRGCPHHAGRLAADRTARRPDARNGDDRRRHPPAGRGQSRDGERDWQRRSHRH